MKTKTIVITTAIAVSIAIVSQAGSWMGGSDYYDCDRPMMGRMMYNNSAGSMMGRGGNFALTAEEQTKIKAIKAGYEEKLRAGETAIKKKIAELDRAYGDKSTTIFQADALRNDLYNLRDDYRQTRRELNLKVAEAIGRRYYGAGGWGPEYCALDGGAYNMGGAGRMMGYGRHCRR